MKKRPCAHCRAYTDLHQGLCVHCRILSTEEMFGQCVSESGIIAIHERGLFCKICSRWLRVAGPHFIDIHSLYSQSANLCERLKALGLRRGDRMQPSSWRERQAKAMSTNKAWARQFSTQNPDQLAKVLEGQVRQTEKVLPSFKVLNQQKKLCLPDVRVKAAKSLKKTIRIKLERGDPWGFRRGRVNGPNQT
jgi:hypothetical protein